MYILFVYERELSKDNNNDNNNNNRICNKILDHDWFSARLFVTLSVRDHLGVQLQLSDLNFL